MKLRDISMNPMATAADKLNSRPRKCLDDKTPYETFFASTGTDVKNILMGYVLIT
jgi:IS30 family transposase